MVGGGEHGTRAVVVAVLANVVIAAAAITAAGTTGSSSVLAVGVQATAGAASQLLLLLAVGRAEREADERHPAGYGRERWYWAFVLSVGLFGIGAAVAIVNGIGQLEDAQPLTSPEWAFGVLGGAILLVAAALRAAVVRANESRRRATWGQFLRSSTSPSLPVVIIQHLGAGLGLLVALGAVTAAEATDDAGADGIGGIAVGAVLGIVALVLVVEVRSLLIGRSATGRDVEAITAALEIDPAVRRLISLRTQHQGPDEVLVGARVELDHELTFPEVAEVVHRIERNVRRAVPVVRAMFIEPDVAEERRAPPAVEHHQPGHDIPPEIRARLDAEARRGSLGEHIVVEEDERT